MYCNVLVTKPFDHTFTYKVGENHNLKIGSVVSVPFGKKINQIGIIHDFDSNNFQKNNPSSIKEINHTFNEVLLNEKIIQFINWIADYTLAPKGLVLKLFLINSNIINSKVKFKENLKFNIENVNLNSDQEKAFKIINSQLFKKPSTIVLEGVTGSGKTEVYFEAIEKIIKQKKQVLIMLPEISLTPQLESRIKVRFGLEPAVWHSKVSQKKRESIWHMCLKGHPIIVIGARSSLFLPFKNLGIIVVDEEHDLSFKQEENIRYQARDLAIVRSKIEKFPIILSSATPSLETQNNINKKKYIHVYLPNQFSGLDLPEIELIDLKKAKIENNKWISPQIIENIDKTLKSGEQVLLFLNRRGYAPLSLCSSCGHRFQCNNCSSWLVMHQNNNRLLCHHCGSIYEIKNHCPSCNEKKSIKLIGPGIERLAEEISKVFPKYNVCIMSSDNANTPNKIKKIVKDFDSKKINILVATQIMAKGYDFSNLSLVGIIDADAGLIGGDVRAIERTYNLLQQVSGRAGRSKKIGKVLLQTYFPNQPIIKSLVERNRNDFVKQILSEREQFKAPPFYFLTAMIIACSSKANAKSYALNLIKNASTNSQINILGPVESPIFLLRGLYRYRILLKGDSRRKLNKLTRNLIENTPPPSNLRLIIDVDPYSFS